MSSENANENNSQIKYIKDVLVPEIVSKFENEHFLDVEIDCSTGLDGFMSALYNVELRTKSKHEVSNIQERWIIIKLMKGDNSFRESSKSYIQFANEVFIYDKVLPAYAELLNKAKITDISVGNWVPHCYVAKFGYIKGLSEKPSSRECILALENLKPCGYKMGPRLYLNSDHLFLMAKTLGQYHSMSYALRQHDDAQFEALRSKIIPLPFLDVVSKSVDSKKSLYGVIYRIAFDRFFEYFDRLKKKQTVFDQSNPDDAKLLENVHRLREKYFERPEALLEHFRLSIEDTDEDRRFGAILHGDFNRNNVMFRYRDGDSKVEDLKLIDFQEIRYGTPVIDLSFFMYFNTSTSMRIEVWMDLLRAYHHDMHKTLESILNGLKFDGHKATDTISKVLEQYSFEKFYAHFSRYAFYGVMICLHFLPWILCSEEECQQLSQGFETDMHGDEFYKISMTAGGDDANKCILDAVRHASKLGYMDQL